MIKSTTSPTRNVIERRLPRLRHPVSHRRRHLTRPPRDTPGHTRSEPPQCGVTPNDAGITPALVPDNLRHHDIPCTAATLPQTAAIPRQYPLMLCGQDSAQCNHLCSTRRSELAPCDSADGFDDPELLVLGHAILAKQCELGFGCPLAVSEVPERAVIIGHNRAEFLKMVMLLLGWGPPTPEFARAISKRRLKDSPARHGQTTTQSDGDSSTDRLQFYPVASLNLPDSVR